MRTLTFCLLAGSALAEDPLEQLAPARIERELPRRASGTSPSTPGVKDVKDEGEILLPSLLDVIIDGEESPALRLLAKPYLGKPVTLATLQRLRAELEQWFVTHDQPVTQVILPPQEITSGTITYQINRRRAGRVLMQGTTRFGRKFITHAFTTRPEDGVSATTVAGDLVWMNENPFRRVDITYTDGQDNHHADLLLTVNENRPWRFFTGWNNGSSERLGDHRLLAGASFGNLWGADHQLSVQWLSATDPKELGAFAASYVIPLPWRHLLEINAISSRSDTSLRDDLDLSGDIQRGSLKYRIPLTPHADWRTEIFLGAEYQENSYTLSSDDGRNSERGATIFNLSAGGELLQADSLGYTRGRFEGVWSPGIAGADDADYTGLRAGADASWWLIRGSLDRSWWMPWESTLRTFLSGQYAGGPLLSSERYAATGYNEVRGYDESAALGDSVLRFTTEWQGPALKLPQGRVIPIGFYDMALLHNVNAGSAVQPDPLHAIGIGLRCQVGGALSLKADLGFPLTDPGGKEGKADPRLHFSLLWSY